MFKLIVNSLRKRAKVVLILLPILLVSDQLWAKSSKLLILGAVSYTHLTLPTNREV